MSKTGMVPKIRGYIPGGETIINIAIIISDCNKFHDRNGTLTETTAFIRFSKG